MNNTNTNVAVTGSLFSEVADSMISDFEKLKIEKGFKREIVRRVQLVDRLVVECDVMEIAELQARVAQICYKVIETEQVLFGRTRMTAEKVISQIETSRGQGWS